MQPTVTIKRLGWLAAATIVLGVLIGVGAGLLTLLLYGVEHVLLGYIEGPELPGPFGVPAARRAISVTVGLSVAGIIWYLLRHKTTAVPSVKKAVAGKRMPFWQTIAHVVLQIFIVGSGASIGREVAPRELGAMLAQRFCDLFHIEGVDGIDRRMVVAVAADGCYAINKSGIDGKSVDHLAAALRDAAKAGQGTVVIISADALAPHQSVISVMEAARRVGLTQITFATQSSARAGAGK